jgi:hypothetical protein
MEGSMRSALMMMKVDVEASLFQAFFSSCLIDDGVDILMVEATKRQGSAMEMCGDDDCGG